MEAKLKFPDEFIDVLEKPVEKSLLELIAVGLYRVCINHLNNKENTHSV